VTHCRAEEAEQTVRKIEKDVEASTGHKLPPAEGSLIVHPRKSFGLGMILRPCWARIAAEAFWR
jgi:hypothetical protein